VYVVPDSDPNAFATGRNPESSSIAVTCGLLDTLDREELQGVVAHEMSHIRNLDIRVMTVVAALVGAVALLSDWARRGMMWGGGSRRRDSGRGSGGSGALGVVFLVIWLVAIALAPFMAQMLAMMVSRRREYLADASGAELTRNPIGLAHALEKIEGAAAPTEAIKRGSAHLCIADPLGRRMNIKEGFWSDLFASHPPMASRIAALKAMAFES
jgi:heat shock protein HtpX